VGFRDLLAFMTGLPVGGGSLERAARSFHLAPLVGVVEGLVAAAAVSAATIAGSPEVLAGAIYIATHIALTGGIHLDGFSDYMDVVGSRLRGEAAVRVLKDPRRGSYAIAWTFTILALSLASIAAVSDLGVAALAALLAAAYLAAAEAAYTAIALGSPPPYPGLASKFKAEVTRGRVFVNIALYTVLAAAVAAASLKLIGPEGLAAALAAAATGPLAGAASAIDAGRRLGFVSGDVAGFAFEASRTAALTLAAIAVSA